MQIKILWVGKTKNSALRTLCDDYLERTRRLTRCEVLEVRDGSRGRGEPPVLVRLAAEAADIEKHLPSHSRIVVLDPDGRELRSEEFASWLQHERNRGARDLRFVVGGPYGIDPALVRRAHLRLSLGRMTWTHEMARVLLLEQLYRALSLLEGIPYHK